MFKSLSFQAKLSCVFALLVALIVSAMGLVTYTQVKGALTSLAKADLTTNSQTVKDILEMQNEISSQKLKGDLTLLEKAITDLGYLSLDDTTPISMTITNQLTRKEENVTIPTLQLSVLSMARNTEIVDTIQHATGAVATIFQVLPDKLLRVSTNVKNTNGKRATGTYIPSSSPVYKAVMQGKTYLGRAFVVDDWYLTTYKPLTDFDDNIVAVIFVGKKILTPALRKGLSHLVVGDGKVIVFDSQDTIIFHPDPKIQGKQITTFPLGKALKKSSSHAVSYLKDGERELADTEYYAPWDWHIVSFASEKSLLLGIDRQILIDSFVTGLIAILIGVLILWFLIKAMMRPLNHLATYSQDVAAGNFQTSISYAAKDSIGATINAVQQMVAQIKNRLGFAQGVLNGLHFPCAVADQDNRLTFINQQMMDLLGLSASPKEFLGKTTGELVHQDAHKETMASKALRENTFFADETTFTRQDGKKLTVSIDAAPIQDLDGNLIGAVSTWFDLTEIRHQQQIIQNQNNAIGRVAQEAHSMTEQLSTAANQLAAQVEQVNSGAQMQQERTTNTATAMEQMNASVMEVAHNASDAAMAAETSMEQALKGEQDVLESVNQMETIRDQILNLNTAMTALGHDAGAIGQIIDVINDIADQTNLLALNAAIEAARAGDAGRGFAVVADEVRKLAEKTMQATRDVGKSINAIRGGVQSNVNATQEAAESIEANMTIARRTALSIKEVVSIIETTSAQVRSIATAAEEQSAASEEVTSGTDDVRHIADETAASMQEATAAVGNLAQIATTLQETIEQLNRGKQEN